MQNRATEYEQFLVYIIYRHFANSVDLEYTAVKAKFAALAYYLIYNVGAVLFTQNGDFNFEIQIDIIRMFSSEIEYSDENEEKIINEIM